MLTAEDSSTPWAKWKVLPIISSDTNWGIGLHARPLPSCKLRTVPLRYRLIAGSETMHYNRHRALVVDEQAGHEENKSGGSNLPTWGSKDHGIAGLADR